MCFVRSMVRSCFLVKIVLREEKLKTKVCGIRKLSLSVSLYNGYIL